MSESLSILALSETGSSERIVVSPSGGSPWNLVVSGLGMQRRVFEGSDLFDALMILRKHLERSGFRLLCAGARRDTYPSGMARSMGGGRKAYVFELSKPATELVDIFAEARPEQVGSVDEQQLFWQQWMTSLKEKLQ